jgi:hypothetical protein
LPKGIVSISIPSVIWLNRVEVCCHCGWKQSEKVSIGLVVNRGNREVNSPVLPTREGSFDKMGQLPSELIHGSSKAADKIAECHGDNFFSSAHFDPADVATILEIGFVDDGIRWRIKPFLERILKDVEVKFRPAGLHFHVYNPGICSLLAHSDSRHPKNGVMISA